MDGRTRLSESDFQNVVKSAKVILVKNIVPCKEFFERLKESRVFPDTMLEEIQACSTIEEKNSKLVNLLLIRGKQTAQPFTDALLLSGHGFLSDFLRDELDLAEEGQESQIKIDKKHLSKKIPRLDLILPEKEKEELIAYMRNRIKEEVIANKWTKSRDTEKVLNVKQTQLEQSSRYREVMKEKDQKIQTLQQNLEQALLDSKTKALEIKHLSNYIEDLGKKHKKEVETQMQFNTANDKSLQRMTEKDNETEAKLQKMIQDMENCLRKNGSEEEVNTKEQTDDGSITAYQIKLNPLDKARAYLDRMFGLLYEMIQFKDQCHHLEDERKQIMVHLGLISSEDHFMEEFRNYLVKNEEKLDELNRQIQELESSIKEKSITESDSVVSHKKVVETLTAEIAEKDGAIKKLNQENKKLINRISQLKTALSDKENGGSSKKDSGPVTLSPPVGGRTSIEANSAAAEGLMMHKGSHSPPKPLKIKDTRKQVNSTKLVPVTTFQKGGVTLTISSMMGGYKQALDASSSPRGNSLPSLDKNRTFSQMKGPMLQYKK